MKAIFAFLFSTLVFANDPVIEKTINVVEKNFNTNCTFVSDSKFTTCITAACYNTKKYLCSNAETSIKLNFTIKSVNLLNYSTSKVVKASFNIDDKLITDGDQTVQATVQTIADTFATDCKFKKNTIGMCLGGADPYYGTVGGICYSSKKYICGEGKEKFKVFAKVKETIGLGDSDETLRKFVIKF